MFISLKLTAKAIWKIGLLPQKRVTLHVPSPLIFRDELLVSGGYWYGSTLGYEFGTTKLISFKSYCSISNTRLNSTFPTRFWDGSPELWDGSVTKSSLLEIRTWWNTIILRFQTTGCKCSSYGWWFQTFFMFTFTWGDDPTWHFFQMVETTT